MLEIIKSYEEILDDFPVLTQEDIVACLSFASEVTMSTAIDIGTLVVCRKPVEGGPALWEAEFQSLKLPFGINQD